MADLIGLAEPEPRIAELFNKSGGKAWEPPDMRHPWIKKLIADGYLRPCTMRCGFEAFDSGVEWTPAALALFRAHATKEINDGTE